MHIALKLCILPSLLRKESIGVDRTNVQHDIARIASTMTTSLRRLISSIFASLVVVVSGRFDFCMAYNTDKLFSYYIYSDASPCFHQQWTCEHQEDDFL